MGDGDVADKPEAYESLMSAWRGQAYEEALKFRKMSPEEDRIRVYQKYLEGDQWNQFGRRARYKSSAYINKTGLARTTHLALLTDSRPDIEVRSRSKDPDAIAHAKMIRRIIEEEWINNDMDLSLVSVADIAAVCGTGFAKLSASAPGMMRMQPCGPDMVMPIQPGFGIQESTAVLYRTWKPLAFALQKFPRKAKEIDRNAKSSYLAGSASAYTKPDHLDSHTWSGLAPQMQRFLSQRSPSATDMSLDTSAFKSVEWQEYYIDDLSVNESRADVIMRAPNLTLEEHNWWYRVKPGQRLYPRKRLVIFIGDSIVYDGPSPYWHGLYPFATLRLNPVFWSFWGLSKYRDLLPMNDAINQIVSGLLDMVKRALNPTTIAKGSSVSNEAWMRFLPDMPGSKLRLDGTLSNPQQDIQFSRPPEIPSYVFQALTSYLGPEFDKLTGIFDIAVLGGKKQVPGGDTIEQIRDANPSGARLEGRLTEVFLRDSGVQAVSNTLQFYGRDRRVELAGDEGLSLPDFMGDPSAINRDPIHKFDYWKNFPVRVTPGSMHGGARDRTKLMMIQLFDRKAISRQKLLEELEINDVSDEELMAMQQGAEPTSGAGSLRLTRGQRNGSPV
jgi:hypothetical protein